MNETDTQQPSGVASIVTKRGQLVHPPARFNQVTSPIGSAKRSCGVQTSANTSMLSEGPHGSLSEDSERVAALD